MSHCPQCGEPTPEGARACPFCGASLVTRAPPTAARTMVGVSVRELTPKTPSPPAAAPPPAAGATKVGRTIVGMPASALAKPEPPAPEAKPAANRTMVGLTTTPLGTPAARAGAAPAGPAAGAQRAGGTLLGVARPGIAPLAPDERPPEDEPDPPNYEPARELGATMGADALRDIRPPSDWQRKDHKQRRALDLQRVAPRKQAPPAGDEPVSRRALAVVLAAGGLAIAAVLVAIFWPSPPPLTARARADAGGREGVELTCKSCPDGTKVTISGASAVMAGGVALVPLPAALSVGENRFRVEIDRPENGRDETVGVAVNVAYRIRPDLASLQAERPAFQIIAEAATGTTISIDGRKLPLAAGRGVESVDVTDVCTGLANDVKTLARQIPYVITPQDGPAEQGVVNVSVGIVPLHLDAPVAVMPTGTAAAPPPHVITDGPSFVLAGWTMKGAEVLAAGRPITVHPDGSFAQVMNVSSVGSTTIEVRARMPGMAPRLSQIKVRRVDSLEKAARDFAPGEPTVGYRDLAGNIGGAIGKAVTLAGEVAETKKQGHQTVMLLDVAASSGCPGGGACTVRLVQGGDNAAKRGDTLRVFGHVARAFSVAGRADIPEIEVDFTLKGGAK
ncbi:MAG: zinc ribbon domain-containing protein [Minicystis sp.]